MFFSTFVFQYIKSYYFIVDTELTADFESFRLKLLASCRIISYIIYIYITFS